MDNKTNKVSYRSGAIELTKEIEQRIQKFPYQDVRVRIITLIDKFIEQPSIFDDAMQEMMGSLFWVLDYSLKKYYQAYMD